MKKGKITALTLATVLAGGTLSGCFGGENKEYVFDSIIGYNEEYNVGDQFSCSGIKIRFKEKGNNVYKIIEVTENMLKSIPDFSTSGEKKL